MDTPDLLNRYFEGSLSPEENKAFQEALDADPVLKEEWLFRKELQAGLHILQRKQDKELLRKWDAERKNRFPVKKLLAVAALFAVIALIYWVYSGQQQHNKLYTDYFQAYPNVIHPIVRGETTDTGNGTIRQAFQFYEQGNYEAAGKLFEQVNKLNQEDYTLFYAAICRMETGEMKQAIQIFESIQWKKDEYSLKSWAEWYRALAYLNSDQTQLAKEILSALSKENHPSATMANKLVRHLN
jgi:tetratricopeptide (TPR) repeat protein